MQQKGFTLIELIIVIVILGILAVTAAPRFINLSSDATASTLQGVKAALQSGGQLVYAKSAIAGIQNNDNTATDSSVSVSGNTVSTHYGYPDAVSATDAAGNDSVNNWVQLDLINDFDFTPGAGSNASAATPALGTFAISPKDATTDFSSSATTGRCYVVYSNSQGPSVAPVVNVVSNDC